ncbi:hypothetical protein Cflav_PD1461 [Pedosphaera parvula Ellin514]|uniref:Uncharacterized protein n=1 Tax=Pedosphaera parvula (strain Ellin514) TaxID=320771 RepID=B9XPT6_PEDPL|nr:hypothetical protein Cflav_PD1461 [Pedosphaera parvula Ellin514]
MKTRRIKFTELKSKRKRFGGLDCSGRMADCKSAIQQAVSLRYLAGSSVGVENFEWRISSFKLSNQTERALTSNGR